MGAPGDAASGCLSCSQTSTPDLPPRERVFRSARWRIAHAFDAALPGWLVVLPTRHLTALDELDAEEAAELGPLLRDASAALREVVGCVKTYVMLFAEAEGFAHLHFHLVPRMADQPDAVRGPRIIQLLGVPPEQSVPPRKWTASAWRWGSAWRPAEQAQDQAVSSHMLVPLWPTHGGSEAATCSGCMATR